MIVSRYLDFTETQYKSFHLGIQEVTRVVILLSMVTTEEQRFIEYWEENRLKRKRSLRQLAIGLPLGLLIGMGIIVNVASGWYKRAAMVINAKPSFVLVLIIAIILIVLFISIFQSRLRWDQNEQRYRELVGRKETSKATH